MAVPESLMRKPIVSVMTSATRPARNVGRVALQGRATHEVGRAGRR